MVPEGQGLVERLDTGQLAISAAGVDIVEKKRLRLGKDHLLTAGGAAPGDAEGRSTRSGTAYLLVFPGATDPSR